MRRALPCRASEPEVQMPPVRDCSLEASFREIGYGQPWNSGPPIYGRAANLLLDQRASGAPIDAGMVQPTADHAFGMCMVTNGVTCQGQERMGLLISVDQCHITPGKRPCQAFLFLACWRDECRQDCYVARADCTCTAKRDWDGGPGNRREDPPPHALRRKRCGVWRARTGKSAQAESVRQKSTARSQPGRR